MFTKEIQGDRRHYPFTYRRQSTLLILVFYTSFTDPSEMDADVPHEGFSPTESTVTDFT